MNVAKNKTRNYFSIVNFKVNDRNQGDFVLHIYEVKQEGRNILYLRIWGSELFVILRPQKSKKLNEDLKWKLYIRLKC